MITVEMSQENWIKVLDMLSEYPFKEVAQIMQIMQQQIVPQVQQQQQLMQSKANGELHAPGGHA